MLCVKCGKDTEPRQVFCPDCLSVMERYPVKPGTPIHIPRTRASELRRPPHRKRGPTAEERITQLQVTVQRLALLSVVLMVAVGVLSGVLAYVIMGV